MGRHDRGIRQCANSSEGLRLPAEAELQGRRPCDRRPVAVSDRRSRVQGRARPGAGESGPSGRSTQTAPAGPGALHGALQSGGHFAPGVRYPDPNHARNRGPGTGGAGGSRVGAAQRAVDARELAHRRHRRNRQDAGRRPGRAHDAADDGLATRPDQSHLPDKRARVSALRRADQAAPRKRSGEKRAGAGDDPGQRQALQVSRSFLCRQSPGQRADRDDYHPGNIPESRLPPPSGSVRENPRRRRYQTRRTANSAERSTRDPGTDPGRGRRRRQSGEPAHGQDRQAGGRTQDHRRRAEARRTSHHSGFAKSLRRMEVRPRLMPAEPESAAAPTPVANPPLPRHRPARRIRASGDV